jgi:HK97 family phage prohead protease
MNKKVIKYLSKAPEKKDDRVLRFVGSDESVDRDNERVLSSGWKLDNYKKNPVVMLNHRHSDVPVAKAQRVWINKNEKALMFDVKFPEPEISSVGDTLYKLYSSGYMNATSVGFQPNYDKIEWGDGIKVPRVTFHEQELLELSLVSVPSNPRSLLSTKGIKDAIEAEVVDQLELDELLAYFESTIKADLIDDTDEEDLEDLIEEVDKELELETSDDEEDIEQTVNKIYCHKCGEEIQDDPDSGYLDKLFDDFLKPKVNKEDEEISLTDELLNQYFTE